MLVSCSVCDSQFKFNELSPPLRRCDMCLKKDICLSSCLWSQKIDNKIYFRCDECMKEKIPSLENLSPIKKLKTEKDFSFKEIGEFTILKKRLLSPANEKMCENVIYLDFERPDTTTILGHPPDVDWTRCVLLDESNHVSLRALYKKIKASKDFPSDLKPVVVNVDFEEEIMGGQVYNLTGDLDQLVKMYRLIF